MRTAGRSPCYPQQLPTPYSRIEPMVVVEIRADTATDHRPRWRHAVHYLRRPAELRSEDVRPDLDNGAGG